MTLRNGQLATLFQYGLESAIGKANISYVPGSSLATKLIDGRRMIFLPDGETIPLVLGYRLMRDKESGTELKKDGRSVWLDGHPNNIISNAFLLELHKLNYGHSKNHYIVLAVGDSKGDKESFEAKLAALKIEEKQLCGHVEHVPLDGRWNWYDTLSKSPITARSMPPDPEVANYLTNLKRECITQVADAKRQ